MSFVENSPVKAARAKPRTRREQRDATRDRLLDVAVEVLIAEGVGHTSTVEVQKRAGVSRGTLLHHFPTHAELLSATVARLVRMNEKAIWQEADALAALADPIERAVQTLANAFAHPSFAAELELWAVARADARLRQALRDAERQARDSRDRVLAALFAPVGDLADVVSFIELSTEFVRGLTLSNILRESPATRERLIKQWIGVLRQAVEPPDAGHPASSENGQ